MSNTYTLAQVAKHADRTSLWIVVDGKVYDCTAFQKDHPGGPAIIRSSGGKDCTKDFYESHLPTKPNVKKLLKKTLIGTVDLTKKAVTKKNATKSKKEPEAKTVPEAVVEPTPDPPAAAAEAGVLQKAAPVVEAVTVEAMPEEKAEPKADPEPQLADVEPSTAPAPLEEPCPPDTDSQPTTEVAAPTAGAVEAGDAAPTEVKAAGQPQEGQVEVMLDAPEGEQKTEPPPEELKIPAAAADVAATAVLESGAPASEVAEPAEVPPPTVLSPVAPSSNWLMKAFGCCRATAPDNDSSGAATPRYIND